MEDFVPQDHLLRKIDKAVDFNKLYEIVEELYCPNNGRPSIDPKILFKMVLIQHLYGIRSLRRTHEEIKMNVAYRWFLGYSMNDTIPHFATVSYNFKHRFTEETVEKVFVWILSEIDKKGFLSPEVVFVDGTHIKANANMKKSIKKEIPVAAKIYEKQLFKEINEDRVSHGKKELKEKEDKESHKEITVSTTDPESGVFHKGEHKKCFAYEAHTACDKMGYVLGTYITPGNIHDSVAFDPLFEYINEKFKTINAFVGDSAYKTTWISKNLIDRDKVLISTYTSPKGNKEKGFRPKDFIYDEYYDCVICPENEILKYSTTTRDGYREFKSNPQICRNCPNLKKCTKSKNNQKVVTKHIWADYIEKVEDYRHTPEYNEIYKKRKETIERVFADAKEKYGMRYTTYRGLAQVTKWVKLKFACMNLKKLALHIRKTACVYIKILVNSIILHKNKPCFAFETGFIDSLNREQSSLFNVVL